MSPAEVATVSTASTGPTACGRNTTCRASEDTTKNDGGRRARRPLAETGCFCDVNLDVTRAAFRTQKRRRPKRVSERAQACEAAVPATACWRERESVTRDACRRRRNAAPCHALSSHVTPYHAMCHVTQCHFISRLAINAHRQT